MADFSTLQPMPNFAEAALRGYQAGQQIRKQQATDAALQGIDLTRPETLMPLVRADPATGAALLSVSSKYVDAAKEAKRTEALSNYLISLQPGQAPHPGAVQAIMPGAPEIGASGIPPASVVSTPQYIPDPNDPAFGGLPPPAPLVPAAQTAPAQTDGNSDIVVNGTRPATTSAPPPSPDPAAARIALIKTDPDAFLKIQDNLATMDKNQRQHVEDATNLFGSVLEAGKDANGNWLPPAQLKAVVQANRQRLIAAGLQPDQIDGFDGSAGAAQQVENQVLGVKGILEHHDKTQAATLDEARAAETARHDRADEVISAQNASTSAGQLGVARGRLGLAKTVAGATGVSSASTSDLLAIARGQKGAPKPSTSDIFAIAGEH